MPMIGRRNKRLQCQVITITYDFLRRVGVAYFPEDNCCDMDGIISLFTGIDPEIRFIQTFAGKLEDTCYRQQAGKWKAV